MFELTRRPNGRTDGPTLIIEKVFKTLSSGIAIMYLLINIDKNSNNFKSFKVRMFFNLF